MVTELVKDDTADTERNDDTQACPHCGGRTRVTHTWGVRRRRKCSRCGSVLQTREIMTALKLAA